MSRIYTVVFAHAGTVTACLVWVLSVLTLQGQDTADGTNSVPDTLLVGIAGSPPFVTYAGGIPGGISRELWSQVAASEKFNYRLRYYEAVPDLLDAVNSGEVRIGIGPITITEDRAKIVHFSLPYYTANMGMLTLPESYSFWGIIQPFLSTAFLIAVLSLGVILFVVGNLIWLFEHKKNDGFPQTYFRGVGNGMWFALVTFTTVGYGDLAPKTAAGRLIAGLWMVIAMVTASSITAGIATAFAIFSLEEPLIDTPGDLRNKKVAVVEGTTGRDFALRHAALIAEKPSAEAAVEALMNNQVKAVTHDYPVLRYYANQKDDDELRLFESSERSEYYGFCTRQGDSLAYRIDLALLRSQEHGIVHQILNSHGL